MVKILKLFSNIGFHVEKSGSYTGFAINEKLGKIRFEFKNHFLICYINDDTKSSILFTVIYGDIQIGTFITLLHEYGIIKFDFIQDSIEKNEIEINKIFDNNG